MRAEESWLRVIAQRPDVPLRLVCLPHGGGAASAFRAWGGALAAVAEVVAVQYPGREDRLAAPFPADLGAVVHGVADEIAAAADPRPYAIFGHSMGATIGYELAHALVERCLPWPVRLIASGREAPEDEAGGEVHRRDDTGVSAELRRLGGTAPEVLQHPELGPIVLASVRADYRIIETYRPTPRRPMDCPVSVFLGAADPDLGAAAATRWNRATRGQTDVRVFPGGHFYLEEHQDEVLSAVRSALAGASVARTQRVL